MKSTSPSVSRSSNPLVPQCRWSRGAFPQVSEKKRSTSPTQRAKAPSDVFRCAAAPSGNSIYESKRRASLTNRRIVNRAGTLVLAGRVGRRGVIDRAGHLIVAGRVGRRGVIDRAGHLVMAGRVGRRGVIDRAGHLVMAGRVGRRGVIDRAGHLVMAGRVGRR